MSFEAGLSAALAEANAAAGPEEALRALTRLAHDRLGDHAAASRPGMLKDGERDYRVSGCFMITPDRRYNMLIANVGFPAEQARLSIPIGWNHPGRVVETKAPLLLRNIDEHPEFRQFLKTSRMGSSLYAPMIIDGVMHGQIVAAAQARTTYDQGDLERLVLLGHAAAAVYVAKGGPAWLSADYPPANQWRAEERSV